MNSMMEKEYLKYMIKLIFEGEYLNDDGPEAEPFDSINNTQKNEYLSENRCKGKEYDI